jgi:hypothetical protein
MVKNFFADWVQNPKDNSGQNGEKFDILSMIYKACIGGVSKPIRYAIQTDTLGAHEEGRIN